MIKAEGCCVWQGRRSRLSGYEYYNDARPVGWPGTGERWKGRQGKIVEQLREGMNGKQ